MLMKQVPAFAGTSHNFIQRIIKLCYPIRGMRNLSQSPHFQLFIQSGKTQFGVRDPRAERHGETEGRL